MFSDEPERQCRFMAALYPSDVAGDELEPFFSHNRRYRRFQMFRMNRSRPDLAAVAVHPAQRCVVWNLQRKNF
jgi:hypothetical protein